MAYATPVEVPAGQVGLYQMAGLSWAQHPGLSFSPMNRLSPFPMSETVNRGLAPDALEKFKAFGATHAYYFMGTPHESQLTRLLGPDVIELSSSAQVNERLGTKKGSRDAFAAAGVPHPAGTTLQKSVPALGKELAGLLRSLNEEGQFPDKVVIKLNDGASGEGNASLRTSALRDHVNAPDFEARVTATLAQATPVNKNWNWQRFAQEIPGLGALAEVFIPGDDKPSPSVQVDILPNENGKLVVKVAATHEQILGGDDGQVYEGALQPADSAYRAKLREYGKRVGEYLLEQGATGRFAIDFLAVWENDKQGHRTTLRSLDAIEINLREGGTTHPQRAMNLLFPQGALGEDGVFHATPDGPPVEYKVLDKFFPGEGKGEKRVVGLTPDDVSDILATQGGEDGRTFGGARPVLFDPATGVGTIGHVLSSIRWGQMGIQHFGSSGEQVQSESLRAGNAFDTATRALPRKPAPEPGWPELTGQQLGRVRHAREAGVQDFNPARANETELQLAGTDWLRTAATSPDGTRIATAAHVGGKYELQFWNRASGQREPLTLALDTPIRDIRYDDDAILTATAGGRVATFDPETGATRFEAQVHDGLINTARWSPNRRVIISSSFDGTVALTHIDTGTVDRFRIGSVVVRDAAFAPDGASFFAASTDGVVRQISAMDTVVEHNGRQVSIAKGDVIAEYAGHPDGAKAIDLSADGRRLAVTAVDGSVFVWDRSNAVRPIATLKREWNSGPPTLSPDGNHLLFASEDGTVRLLPIGAAPADTAVIELNQVVGRVNLRPTEAGKFEVTAFSGTGQVKSVEVDTTPPDGRGNRPGFKGFGPGGGPNNGPGQGGRRARGGEPAAPASRAANAGVDAKAAPASPDAIPAASVRQQSPADAPADASSAAPLTPVQALVRSAVQARMPAASHAAAVAEAMIQERLAAIADPADSADPGAAQRAIDEFWGNTGNIERLRAAVVADAVRRRLSALNVAQSDHEEITARVARQALALWPQQDPNSPAPPPRWNSTAWIAAPTAGESAGNPPRSRWLSSPKVTPADYWRRAEKMLDEVITRALSEDASNNATPQMKRPAESDATPAAESARYMRLISDPAAFTRASQGWGRVIRDGRAWDGRLKEDLRSTQPIGADGNPHPLAADAGSGRTYYRRVSVKELNHFYAEGYDRVHGQGAFEARLKKWEFKVRDGIIEPESMIGRRFLEVLPSGAQVEVNLLPPDRADFRELHRVQITNPLNAKGQPQGERRVEVRAPRWPWLPTTHTLSTTFNTPADPSHSAFSYLGFAGAVDAFRGPSLIGMLSSGPRTDFNQTYWWKFQGTKFFTDRTEQPDVLSPRIERAAGLSFNGYANTLDRLEAVGRVGVDFLKPWLPFSGRVARRQQPKKFELGLMAGPTYAVAYPDGSKKRLFFGAIFDTGGGWATSVVVAPTPGMVIPEFRAYAIAGGFASASGYERLTPNVFAFEDAVGSKILGRGLGSSLLYLGTLFGNPQGQRYESSTTSPPEVRVHKGNVVTPLTAAPVAPDRSDSISLPTVARTRELLAI